MNPVDKSKLRARMQGSDGARDELPDPPSRAAPKRRGRRRPMQLWSVTCISNAYGVSHTLVVRWTKRALFPEPVAVVGRRCGWDPDEVREWVRKSTRRRELWAD